MTLWGFPRYIQESYHKEVNDIIMKEWVYKLNNNKHILIKSLKYNSPFPSSQRCYARVSHCWQALTWLAGWNHSRMTLLLLTHSLSPVKWEYDSNVMFCGKFFSNSVHMLYDSTDVLLINVYIYTVHLLVLHTDTMNNKEYIALFWMTWIYTHLCRDSLDLHHVTQRSHHTHRRKAFPPVYVKPAGNGIKVLSGFTCNKYKGNV